MLDSGASSSFLPEHLARKWCLVYKNKFRNNVRLADGKLIQTVGQV